MAKITLTSVKKDEKLFKDFLEKLKKEYLDTWMTLEDFSKKYLISIEALKHILRQSHLKKDLSKFNPSKRKEAIEKIKQTKLEKYGSSNYNNKDKNKETLQRRYGVNHPRQVASFNQKGKETFAKNYAKGSPEYKDLMERRVQTRSETLKEIDFGAKIREARSLHQEEDPLFLENIQAKRIKTTLDKYGVENVSQDPNIQNLKKETFKNNYGEDYYWLVPEIRSKYEKTCLERYGVDHFSKTDLFAKSRGKKWICNGLKFDSKWEIYYYFYLKDRNIPFEMQIPIKYIHEEKEYTYICDFKLLENDQLIEIKNPNLIDEDGNLKILWEGQISSSKRDFEIGKLRSKSRCMKEHNVKVLSDPSFFKELEKLFKENHSQLKIEKVI